MASLQDLLAKRAALEQEIESIKSKGRQEAIEQIKTLMAEYGLTLSDVSSATKGKTNPTKGTKVAVKYRNRATGESWSGRGLQPNWLKAAIASGKKLSDFQV